jgi:hypothetical protein
MISEMRSGETFAVFWNEKDTSLEKENHPPSVKRIRFPSLRLSDFDTYAPGAVNLSSFSSNLTDILPNDSIRQTALSTYYNILDSLSGELNRRFGAIHSSIAAAVAATNPTNENFMNKIVLQPLADIAGLTLDDQEL